ncbi:MAG: protein kinase, partial [Butyricicoccaceae bacterium]
MLEIGDIVMDGWKIEKRLGSGASSEVYLVSRDELGQHFERALKHVFLTFRKTLIECGGDQTRALERWEHLLRELGDEIRTQEELSGLESGRFVRYFDHKVELNPTNTECEIFILMERLTPFMDYLAEDEEGMTIAEVVRLGREVADALAVCHSRGVIHCDVKETNLFVSSSGKFKLGDFGAVKHGSGNVETDSMRGTESYLPPEILAPGSKFELTPAVDLYALGIVMYRLLNDMRSPFMSEGSSDAERTAAMLRRASGEVPPPPRHAPDLLGEVVLRLLAAKPEERFASAAELSKVLGRVMIDLTAAQAETVVYGGKGQAAEEDFTELMGRITRAMPTIRKTGLLPRKPAKQRWSRRGRIFCVTAVCALIALGIGGSLVLRDYAGQVQGEYAQALAEQERYNTYLAQFDYEFYEATTVLTGYHGADKDVEVPAVIDERPVTTIRAEAFAGSAVTSVTLPKTVQSIEREAFRDCAELEQINLPDGLES